MLDYEDRVRMRELEHLPRDWWDTLEEVDYGVEAERTERENLRPEDEPEVYRRIRNH